MNELGPVAVTLMTVGLAFDLLGCIGLVRLPDVYNRLQAATKCVTLGTCLLLAGVCVQTLGVDNSTAAKAVLCGVFVLLTNPVSAHALARGAHLSGVRLWEKSVVDKYLEDRLKTPTAQGRSETKEAE